MEEEKEERRGEKQERENNLPSVGSLPRHSQWVGWSQAKARILEVEQWGLQLTVQYGMPGLEMVPDLYCYSSGNIKNSTERYGWIS